jgi:predicted phosphodiesterase
VSLKRWLFASDVHGDQQDSAAVNAMLAFSRDFKPHYRICGGDVWDFRALRGKASEEEKRDSLRADFEAGLAFLKSFSPTCLIRGNHDERLWDFARRDNGPLSDYAGDLCERVCERGLPAGCEHLRYHKRAGVYRLGQLKFLHGFYCGTTAARQHALAYGACVYGHVHARDSASVPGFERRTAQGVGCLCTLDFDYDSKSPGSLRHSQGWAYGVIDEKTGQYEVFVAEGVEGKFFVASEIRAVA